MRRGCCSSLQQLQLRGDLGPMLGQGPRHRARSTGPRAGLWPAPAQSTGASHLHPHRQEGRLHDGQQRTPWPSALAHPWPSAWGSGAHWPRRLRDRPRRDPGGAETPERPRPRGRGSREPDLDPEHELGVRRAGGRRADVHRRRPHPTWDRRSRRVGLLVKRDHQRRARRQVAFVSVATYPTCFAEPQPGVYRLAVRPPFGTWGSGSSVVLLTVTKPTRTPIEIVMPIDIPC
jgi:hypothetical protein